MCHAPVCLISLRPSLRTLHFVSPIFYFILLSFHFIFFVNRFGAKPLCASANEESGPLVNNAPLTNGRPHLSFSMWLTLMYVLNFQCQLIWAFPDRHLWAYFWNFRLSYFECPHALVQVSNRKGTLNVNLYEFSHTFRETFSAHLIEVLL